MRLRGSLICAYVSPGCLTDNPAARIAQLSSRTHFSSVVGAWMGLGAMSGVALWNTSAAAMGAHTTMQVVAVASVSTALCQAGLVAVFRTL